MTEACHYREKFAPYSYLWTHDTDEFLRQFLMYGRQVSVEELLEGIEENPPSLDQYKEQVSNHMIYFEMM